MSHALLLRLFLSPSFFSVQTALQYLSLYFDNIGITYYITRRLRDLPTSELSDVWGFICHLLVTRQSKSRALECFVSEVAHRSTHIAMTTLWFMQASLKDQTLARHDSHSFVICQRTLHMCHEIIFGDLPPPVTTPYSTLNAPFRARFTRRKVKHHADPIFIGIGLVLAGTAAMPKLTEIMGEVAVEQGRMIEEEGPEHRSHQGEDSDVVLGVQSLDKDTSEDEDDNSSAVPKQPGFSRQQETTSKRKGSSRRGTIGASQTSPALPMHLRRMPRSRQSEDPLGQLDHELPSKPMAAYQSTPSLHRPLLRSSTTNAIESLLDEYDAPSQVHLLRSQYCRSEVQFILTLENISNRLLVVPRPARVSALRAELTALNHKLPAEVCMPMWCSSSDTARASGSTQPHHRIVRIPPGESVVLNSAERAPYVLLIEILHDDLDFDPAKRNNKEVLKKIVAKETERKGASRDLISFASLTSPPTPRPLSHKHKQSITDANAIFGDGALPSPMFAEPTTSVTNSADEEIDLVEQLYGADQSLRSRTLDLSESIVLPPRPKNRELDIKTWSRPSSIPPSPAPDALPKRIPPSLDIAPPLMPDTDEEVGATLSLDEYSERMRTAAIMLAQLNANMIRDPSTAVPLSGLPASIAEVIPQSASALTWLASSSWSSAVTPTADDPVPNRGPIHPSLASAGPATSSFAQSNAPSRLRLQHAEAAAIRDRIMKEMLSLEEERMERMRENREGEGVMHIGSLNQDTTTAEDETIIRRELNKADPSAVVFSESWTAKKARIRSGSPYGHLASWDCVSVIVKTGNDLRQEQLAVQLIREFERIWKEEQCPCWVRYFRILITGGTSGIMETMTDAVSIHSIKKAEYARRLAVGRLGHVTLLDHFKVTYGDPSSAKFARAQRNFAKSLAGYSIVTYLLQIKDRHNGNILLDRDGHLIHIDFGFMLSNSPGNIGFEAAPFKLPPEYIEVLGGINGAPFLEFRRLFREGFEAARKHCDRVITLVELMQKDSSLPCFAAFGEQTANQLRERFQPALTHSLVGEYVDRLIDTSLGSNWTRLYDSYQYYSQSIL